MLSNIAIIYGSTTGNTKSLSFYLQKLFVNNGQEANVLNSAEIPKNFNYSNYSVLIFGFSTWGVTAPALQEDFEQYLDEINLESFQGKKIFVFGLGDSYYPYFAGGIELFREKLLKSNIKILDEIKIDTADGIDTKLIDNWFLSLKKKI